MNMRTMRRRTAAPWWTVTAAMAAATLSLGAGWGPRSVPAAVRAAGGKTYTVAAKKTKLGVVLVDAAGYTLYRYTADRRDTSHCTWSGCTTLWPPLAAPARLTAGPGVDRKALSIIKGPHGQRQVAYDGWPLYTYIGDTKPGQTNGEKVRDTHGIWYVVYAQVGRNPRPRG
jgi:predicted lipoprotein with Yx(FWY)xxD motif